MINLCNQCKYNGSKRTCRTCNGNPNLTDKFKQKELRPLEEIVTRGGYEFGSTNRNRK